MTNVQIIDAMERERIDQVTWHRAKGCLQTVTATDAFEAGFNDGWRQAVRFLKLHGALKVRA